MPTTRGSAPTAINYNTNSSSSSTPSSSTTSPAHRQSTGLDAGDVLSDNYEQGCDGCIIIGLGLRGRDFDSQPSPATSRSLDSSIAVDDSHVDRLSQSRCPEDALSQARVRLCRGRPSSTAERSPSTPHSALPACRLDFLPTKAVLSLRDVQVHGCWLRAGRLAAACEQQRVCMHA